MATKISSFTKDGKEYPVIELKDDKNKQSFGFTFGLGKAKLILANIEEIKQFVIDHEEAK